MMNREQAYKSMGVFSIYKEALKIIASRKIIFAQITLAILVPVTILYLSQTYMLYLIQEKIYQDVESPGPSAYVYGMIVAVFINAIIVSFFASFLTSNAVYATTCFYTSKDITFQKVVAVFPKVCKRLFVTLLWCCYMVRIYTITGAALGLSLWYFLIKLNEAEGEGWKQICLILVGCISIPFFAGLVYMTSVWNIATVIATLEEEYGKKALLKSMRLIRGRICVASAAFVLLEITILGILSAFIFIVVGGCISSFVGTVFAGIVCYSSVTIVVHFSLVIRTVVYFVCKSYHREDIWSITPFPDVSYVSLDTVNRDDGQLHGALV